MRVIFSFLNFDPAQIHLCVRCSEIRWFNLILSLQVDRFMFQSCIMSFQELQLLDRENHLHLNVCMLPFHQEIPRQKSPRNPRGHNFSFPLVRAWSSLSADLTNQASRGANQGGLLGSRGINRANTQRNAIGLAHTHDTAQEPSA